MCKLIKRAICLIIIASVGFLAVALWSGGDKFRSIGRKTGGFLERTCDDLGDKADAIKGRKDEAAGVVKKLSGGSGSDEESGPATEKKEKIKPQKKAAKTNQGGEASPSVLDRIKRLFKKVKSVF